MLRVIKIYIFAVVLFSAALAASDVKIFLSISPKEVYSGEEVQVALNIESLKRVKVEYSELDKIASFPVISIKDSSKNVIDEVGGGKRSLVRLTRTYTVIPTKNITIAPIEVKIDGKIYSTKTEVLKVRGASTKGDNFLFRMSSDKKELVVGEPFIIKIELIEPVAFNSPNIEYLAPKFEEFEASTLGAGESVKKGNRVVRTIKYLLTPKSAGEFVIDPATAKIEMQVGPEAQTPFAFFGTESQWKNIVSNTIKVRVKELPQKVNVIGEFKIRQSINKLSSSAKKPIEMTLKISGRGSLQSLKNIAYSIPNVTIYSKEPKIEHVADEKGIQSSYTRKFVFISEHDFSIPSLSLKGYDTEKKALYELQSKAYNIHIKESSNIMDLLNRSGAATKAKEGSKEAKVHSKINEIVGEKKSSSSNIESLSQESKKIEDILLDKEYFKRRYIKDSYSFATVVLLVIVAFLFGLLSAWYIPKILVLLGAKKTKSTLYNNYNEALSILYPHTTEDSKIEEMVKKLYEVVNGNESITIDTIELERMIKKIKRTSRKKK
ncbi:MAG TPA: hypothetical protein ENL00_00925 [Nitratifractor sp.]|nr:hypothetical protein [Nitratifractor sp.]HHD74375.1 hypothetical protein [Nitratifractor sp.]